MGTGNKKLDKKLEDAALNRDLSGACSRDRALSEVMAQPSQENNNTPKEEVKWWGINETDSDGAYLASERSSTCYRSETRRDWKTSPCQDPH
jgi:hypothetical protein